MAVDVTAENFKDHWVATVEDTRRYHPDCPKLALVLPTQTYHGEFELQDGHVRAFLSGPVAHAG